MHTLEINEVKKVIGVCPNEINLMFVGDSGIGKTTVVEEYCKENGYFLKTLILSKLEPSEALGVPTVTTKKFGDQEYKTMESAIPSWVFDLASHEKAMLFMDEFLCAEPSVMNSFLNLLSQKQIESIDLHHVKFVAATNIGMYTFEPDFNILTRFCFFYTVNTTYDTNMPFIYHYKDESSTDGPIFEKRRLVPRCASSLKLIQDPNYISMFYEGFTNELPVTFKLSDGLKYSNDISMIVYNFASQSVDKNGETKFTVHDDLLKAMCEQLYKKYPRGYDQVINSITILSDLQKSKASSLKNSF